MAGIPARKAPKVSIPGRRGGGGRPFGPNNPPPKQRGRTPGSKNKITELKLALIASSGMTPLDFMTFVYRDQLYDKYVETLAPDGKTVMFEKAPDAKKIDVNMNQRISCAVSAAPYVHKKMPVGIEVKDKNTAIISTEKLRSMKEEELAKLLDFMDRFGLSVDLASTAEVRGLPAPE